MTERHKLTAIDLDEVSLVEESANRGARVMLFKRSEDEVKEMTKEKGKLAAEMVVIAKSGDTEKIERFAKWQWYQAVRDLGDSIRKPGETKEKSRCRAMETLPEGRLLRKAYQEAKGPAVDLEAEETRTEGEILPALIEATVLAEGLIEADPGLSISQARAQVWKNFPTLRDAYDEERRAALKRRG